MAIKKGSILVNTVSFIAYILLAIMALLVIFSSFEISGYRMFVVRSGSMEPEFSKDSVVLDRKQDVYSINDIITFKISNETDTVTHRIVGIEQERDTTFYIVKGDANKSADSEKVIKENVIGKVVYSVPYIGNAVSFLKTPKGLVLFILIPALIIIYGEIGKIKKELEKIKTKKKEKSETKEKNELLY